ncbi:MAG: signal recognition particle-docking protein FtsY [Acidimicrobiia bacterium]
MDPAIIIPLILVLAVVLATVGIVLSRRSQKTHRGEVAPPASRPTSSRPANPTPTVTRTPSTPVAEPEAEGPSDAVAEAVPDVEVEGEAPRLRDRLGRTRGSFLRSLAAVRGRNTVDDATWDELEETLLLADVGLPTTERILDDLRARAKDERISDPETLIGALRDELVGLLESTGSRELVTTPDEMNVWMFVGVNGVGKTTSIAKVAQREVHEGHTVVLAAADTFRAAAADQLTHWAERVGAGIVKGQEGADPGSVVFDAMSSAESRRADLVLVDTAGRLHTKVNLMNELEKLRRIVDRTPGALKEMLLVIDASTGQNGLSQARQFTEAVEVSGVVLTKLDGTAKGGIVLAIEAELGIPVKLVGLGESAADLVEFEPANFVDALLS